MEKEKEEKRENILKITKQITEVARDSYLELESQGSKLKKTQKDVNDISKHITSIDKNLGEIEKHRSKGFKNYLDLVCCCIPCSEVLQISKNEQINPLCKTIIKDQVKYSTNDEHLSPERIELEWCSRYDPEGRWINQVESGLDYLLELAEQMKKSFDDQNKLAEQILLDVRANHNRMKSSRNRMKSIQETKN